MPERQAELSAGIWRMATLMGVAEAELLGGRSGAGREIRRVTTDNYG